MRLWTIQHIEVYESLKRDKVFYADPEKSECLKMNHFKTAYEWMILQMKEKIGAPPSNVKTPIWAWHTYNWACGKNIVNSNEFDIGRTNMVCIELEIPDNDVLLSDEEAWHFVLSDLFIPKATSEDEAEKQNQEYESCSKIEKENMKLISWNNIFDIESFNNGQFWNGRYVQAAFWEMKMEQVKAVTYL